MPLYLPLQSPSLKNECSDFNYQYQEFLPRKHLQSYVACYWTLNTHTSNKNDLHRIIPDGCVDIIIDLNASSVSKGAFAVGLMTTYETISLTSSFSLFGIRFFIDHAHQFFKYPVSELIGDQVFLEDLWGSEAKFIMEEIITANGISEKIEKVELLLIRFLLQNETRSDQLLQSSINYMYASQGKISIRTLSEKLSYTERNVRRSFQKELGVSPKELLDILRFQYLLRELYNGIQSGYTDVALKYGYYDQSHFIHNFKRFYGLSPSQVFN